MGLFDVAVSYMLFTVVHFFCFALSLAVCGLYGTDLQRANEAGVGADSKWVFAVVVGAMSAVTCVVYFVPFMLRLLGVFVAVWDFILFVLWIAVFGVFGKMYIGENPEGNGGIKRMKNAVWIDLVNALLWLIASIAAAGYWWKHRDNRSRFTGRAKV
jgi:Zn-dependent protease